MFLREDKTEMSKIDSIKSTVSSKHDLASLNVEKLKSVLSYFSYLHSNGEISDKAFEALVRYACSIFLENEVEVIIQETLERKFMQFLSSKFSTSPVEIEDLEAAFSSFNVSRLMRSK
ncbi:hypothetical protein BZZ01_21280 [Nostocales cyanobacterium HT-58-2]|nr:hypothetical protein BZZ01_21280 [Nostocales cyanobacterium HT-58-2]